LRQQGVFDVEQDEYSNLSSGQDNIRNRNRNAEHVNTIPQTRAHRIGVQENLFIK
jgi:hypothetical protein